MNFHIKVKIPGLWEKLEDVQTLVLIPAWQCSLVPFTLIPFAPWYLIPARPVRGPLPQGAKHWSCGQLKLGCRVGFTVDSRILKVKYVVLVLFLLAVHSACFIHLNFLPGFHGHWSFLTSAFNLKY